MSPLDVSERVMLLGRGQQAMERAFTQVIERLPFAVKELHPDNGTEFFNDHLVRFWKEKVTGVSRSAQMESRLSHTRSTTRSTSSP